jgi:PAS domain S-box-containing protein
VMPVQALQSTQMEDVLEHVNVPSYVIDRSGVIRWVNLAARTIVGDVVGRQFSSVVAPEETRRARELFARKILGTTEVTDAGLVVVNADGARVAVEISSVPLFHGDHVVGVFGQVSERGRSTRQMADELQLSIETVRNHIRHLLRAVGAHSRLEAVAIANQAA